MPCQHFVHIEQGEDNRKEKWIFSDLVDFGTFRLIRRSSEISTWPRPSVP